jgi:hypothetical protein
MEPTASGGLVEKLHANWVVDKLVPDVHEEPDLKPSEFVTNYWDRYLQAYGSNNSRNGKVFEALLSIALRRQGIVPHYVQAKVAHVPDVIYDCIVYTSEVGPISISAKVSLRERWKQADLEAVALKYVHRKALAYLVSMDEHEIRRRQAGSTLGLDGFVLASSSHFDDLLHRIAKEYSPIEAAAVVAVTGTKVDIEERGDPLQPGLPALWCDRSP